MDLPHFGRGQHPTACVKQLLEVTHGRDIWLDNLVSIDVVLIAKIIGLPIQGMDPTLFLDDKTKEKMIEEEMKKKYGITRGTRGIIVKRINNAIVIGYIGKCGHKMISLDPHTSRKKQDRT